MKIFSIKISLGLCALFLGCAPLIAEAQQCYSTFNGQNSFFDGEYSFRLNTVLKDLYVTRTFSGNERIAASGVSAFWRYSTDATTLQRPITTLPGYASFVATGSLTTSGKGSLSFTAKEKKVYFIYVKFLTERGNVSTGAYKITIN